jgi:RNA polymerase sigma-70 factor (ECF subfamily)
MGLGRVEAMDLGALYDAWASRLLAYMMTITRDRTTAEDALHNLFVKLATGRPELRDPAVYLYRAARNEALRVLRRRVERPLADLEFVAAPGGSAEHVADALDRLPAEQLDVVVLHVFLGLSFREASEVLGIPPDTAASRYRYALEKLRGLIDS